MHAQASAQANAQASFDDLGTPLREVTFVVVDLETTGVSPAQAEITEVGAVKVRGGHRLGEFATLVRPAQPIPAFITVLTGITDAMVAGAPAIGAVLPAFLEFAAGSVLVAHNAGFDIGFLRAACAARQQAWPAGPVLDTVRLARRVLTRDDVPDFKLATLARLFRSPTPPVHRALDDARATTDVLHGLLERLGPLGVHSWEELESYTRRVPAALRRQRHLAAGLPHAPGVYLFRGPADQVLYVGRSRDLATRVRSYFTAAETRRRIAEMVRLATRVEAVVCDTELEAAVRELRLIAAHAPPYNRRSRAPERAPWLALTREPFPRISVVRDRRDPRRTYLGPFGSRAAAELARDAVHDAVPIRRCATRLLPGRSGPTCALADLGRCPAPCRGELSPADYAPLVAAVREAFTGDPAQVLGAAERRLATLAAAQRYEEAAAVRDRLAAFLRAAVRGQAIASLAAIAHLVAARPHGSGWEVAVIRSGRLAAAGLTRPGTPVAAGIAAIVATAATVPPAEAPAASAGETELLLDWLGRPGTRLVEASDPWVCSARGAGRAGGWVRAAAPGRPGGRADAAGSPS